MRTSLNAIWHVRLLNIRNKRFSIVRVLSHLLLLIHANTTFCACGYFTFILIITTSSFIITIHSAIVLLRSWVKIHCSNWSLTVHMRHLLWVPLITLVKATSLWIHWWILLTSITRHLVHLILVLTWIPSTHIVQANLSSLRIILRREVILTVTLIANLISSILNRMYHIYKELQIRHSIQLLLQSNPQRLFECYSFFLP